MQAYKSRVLCAEHCNTPCRNLFANWFSLMKAKRKSQSSSHWTASLVHLDQNTDVSFMCVWRQDGHWFVEITTSLFGLHMLSTAKLCGEHWQLTTTFESCAANTNWIKLNPFNNCSQSPKMARASNENKMLPPLEKGDATCTTHQNSARLHLNHAPF